MRQMFSLGKKQLGFIQFSCATTLSAMAPFYQSLCSEAGRPADPALLSKLQEANVSELARLEEALKDARENLGDTEVRDALLAKAEYLTKIGDKVSGFGAGLIPRLYGYGPGTQATQLGMAITEHLITSVSV